MNMIKAILVDDEPRGLKILELLMNAHRDEVQIVAACKDPEDAIQQCQQHQPDLLIMDIQMPNLNAFDVLSTVHTPHMEVIFATAYNSYSLRAFQYSAVDYLLKPIDEDLFHKAVHKAIERIRSRYVHHNYEALLYNIRKLQHTDDMKICIPDAKGFRVISVADILYCEAESCYTIFHLTDKGTIVSSRTLAEYDGLLDPEQFIRIHRSYIVNARHIREYLKGDGGFVVMANQKTLEVSRRKKEDFMARMKGLYKF